MTTNLSDVITMLGNNARRVVTDPSSATPVDRLVLAGALLGAAAIILWPAGKPAPVVVTWVVDTGKAIWLRRDQWTPQSN